VREFNGVKKQMQKIIISSLAIAGIIILSGCSLYGTSSPATPAKTPTPATSSQSQSNAINIQNFAFSPATLIIKKGATVTWTNNDSAPHQIKSATFNSSSLSNGQSFSFTFNDIGSFDYSCAIHPSMTGKIVVE
jgi:plastocyanin